jgi:O-methyltransferase involved in polyketide biosynthesis
MHRSRPSRTAYRVALRRAAHQLLDNPPVFKDPLAISIVSSSAASSLTDPIPRSVRRYPIGEFLDDHIRAEEDGHVFERPHRSDGLQICVSASDVG